MYGDWTAFKKYLTKDQCVTYSGVTLTIDVDGVFLLEEQDTLLVKMSQSNLIAPMA
jgi:hypothetical protein